MVGGSVFSLLFSNGSLLGVPAMPDQEQLAKCAEKMWAEDPNFDEQALEKFYLTQGMSRFSITMVVIGAHVLAIWFHYLN